MRCRMPCANRRCDEHVARRPVHLGARDRRAGGETALEQGDRSLAGVPYRLEYGAAAGAKETRRRHPARRCRRTPRPGVVSFAQMSNCTRSPCTQRRPAPLHAEVRVSRVPSRADNGRRVRHKTGSGDVVQHPLLHVALGDRAAAAEALREPRSTASATALVEDHCRRLVRPPALIVKSPEIARHQSLCRRKIGTQGRQQQGRPVIKVGARRGWRWSSPRRIFPPRGSDARRAASNSARVE